MICFRCNKMSRRLMRGGNRGKSDRGRAPFPRRLPDFSPSLDVHEETEGERMIRRVLQQAEERERQRRIIQEVAALEIPPSSSASETSQEVTILDSSSLPKTIKTSSTTESTPIQPSSSKGAIPKIKKKKGRENLWRNSRVGWLWKILMKFWKRILLQARK